MLFHEKGQAGRSLLLQLTRSNSSKNHKVRLQNQHEIQVAYLAQMHFTFEHFNVISVTWHTCLTFIWLYYIQTLVSQTYRTRNVVFNSINVTQQLNNTVHCIHVSRKNIPAISYPVIITYWQYACLFSSIYLIIYCRLII